MKISKKNFWMKASDSKNTTKFNSRISKKSQKNQLKRYKLTQLNCSNHISKIKKKIKKFCKLKIYKEAILTMIFFKTL